METRMSRGAARGQGWAGRLVAAACVLAVCSALLLFPPQGLKEARGQLGSLAGWSFMVDAGHGGSDSGAVGPTGLRECDVNLSVALKLQSLLEAEGATVHMTRTSDVSVSITSRWTQANDLGVDRFISIHHNAVSDPSANYVIALVSTYAGSDSVDLAGTAVNEIKWELGVPAHSNPVWHVDYVGVLNHTNMPAILTEASFISNPAEEQRLRDPYYNQREADAIFRAIDHHCGGPHLYFIAPEEGMLIHEGADVKVSVPEPAPGLAGRLLPRRELRRFGDRLPLHPRARRDRAGRRRLRAAGRGGLRQRAGIVRDHQHRRVQRRPELVLRRGDHPRGLRGVADPAQPQRAGRLGDGHLLLHGRAAPGQDLPAAVHEPHYHQRAERGGRRQGRLPAGERLRPGHRRAPRVLQLQSQVAGRARGAGGQPAGLPVVLRGRVHRHRLRGVAVRLQPGRHPGGPGDRVPGENGEGNQTFSVRVEAESRYSQYVNQVVGPDRNVSIRLSSNLPVVAERPIYFDYSAKWQGGSAAMGATTASTLWFFGEGCTRSGFEEWLCVQNPNNTPASALITYITADGMPFDRQLELPARSRRTVYVNQDAGPGRDVSDHGTFRRPRRGGAPHLLRLPQLGRGRRRGQRGHRRLLHLVLRRGLHRGGLRGVAVPAQPPARGRRRGGALLHARRGGHAGRSTPSPPPPAAPSTSTSSSTPRATCPSTSWPTAR